MCFDSNSVSSTNNKCSVDTILHPMIESSKHMAHPTVFWSQSLHGSSSGGDHLTAAVVIGYCCYTGMAGIIFFLVGPPSNMQICHSMSKCMNFGGYCKQFLCYMYSFLLLAGLLISRWDDMKSRFGSIIFPFLPPSFAILHCSLEVFLVLCRLF